MDLSKIENLKIKIHGNTYKKITGNSGQKTPKPSN
jgi:hypothetical protein